MAAFLYPGVKSLQLVLDRPYDTIRTTDVRDDLVAIKVWYSLTTPFNPNNGEGTLVPSGNSLNVTIPNLTPKTRYYVKYAFISAIDEDEIDPAGPTGPGSYTVSDQLTAVVLEENMSVYGYLTNDPTPIVTAADGTGGSFSQATGVFKVFNLSSEVTGEGPVYGIKPFSIDSLLGVTINTVTGVYSCTGLSDDGGNVTFTATFNGVTVEQVWNVYRAKAGETAPLIQLSATVKEFVYKDQFSTASITPSTTITARVANVYGPVTFTAQAYKRDSTALGTLYTWPTQSITAPAKTTTLTIPASSFDNIGVEVGYIIITATIGGISDVLTLYRINDGTEQITVYLSNESHGIAAYADGTTTASSYVGSGTLIEVKQGNTYLTVDNSDPFENGTWTVTSSPGTDIACSTGSVGPTFILYGAHSGMSNNKEVAFIDYTIAGKTTTGAPFSIVKRQSFTKSKEGVRGATARAVSITSPSQLFITNKNSTTPSTANVVLTAVQSNFVNPQYTWEIQNPITKAWAAPGTAGTIDGSTFTLNSFPAVASKTVRVTLTETVNGEFFSEFDIFSVYSLREGDDSFSAGLSNENQTITYDSAGQPNSGQFPLHSNMTAWLGIMPLSASSTPPVTFVANSYNGGGTFSIDNTGYITINEPLTQNAAIAVFSAVLYYGTSQARVITKELTISKSKDGNTGEGIAQIYTRSNGRPNTPVTSTGLPTVPAGEPVWSLTVEGTTGAFPLWTSFGQRGAGSAYYTWQTPVRVEGVQGDKGDPLRSATGFIYYNAASGTAPGKPAIPSSYSFDTGAFTGLDGSWATTFTAVTNTNSSNWAIRYTVQETVYGGAHTIIFSNPFAHLNFDGVVTFTNVNDKILTANAYTTLSDTVGTKVNTAGATTAANTAITSSINNSGGAINTALGNKANSADVFVSNTTIIDGGKIQTGTIDVNRLSIGPYSAPNVLRNTGERIVISGTKIEVFDANGTRRVVMGLLG